MMRSADTSIDNSMQGGMLQAFVFPLWLTHIKCQLATVGSHTVFGIKKP